MTIGLIPSQHSAHTLVGTMKWLREDPAERVVRPKGIWPDQDLDLSAFEAWFLSQLHEKINSHLPARTGRKYENDWFMQAWRLARAVNTPRLIVRWAPIEFRARLAHRLTTEED